MSRCRQGGKDKTAKRRNRIEQIQLNTTTEPVEQRDDRLSRNPALRWLLALAGFLLLLLVRALLVVATVDGHGKRQVAQRGQPGRGDDRKHALPTGANENEPLQLRRTLN